MTIYLRKEFANNEEDAKSLQTIIEHTTMYNVTAMTQIFYDPDPRSTIIVEDQQMVELHMALYETEYEKKLDKLSPWVLRIELDSNSMVDKGLNMEFITEKIESEYNDIDIISSDENATKLIIRIRMQYSQGDKKISKEVAHSEEILKNLETAILKDLSLKGIPQIKKVYAKEAKRPSFDPVTGSFSTNNKEDLFFLDTER